MATYQGIDVSTFQGEIDWPRVKAAPIDFAILRASYGWKDPEHQVDARFHQNAKGASAAGVPFGAYHYSYAANVEEAREEAAFFLKVIQGYSLAYPVAYDLEEQAQKALGRDAVTAIAQAWCDEMRSAGYYPMIYSNLSFIRNYLTEEFRKENELWIAQYNDVPTYGNPFVMGLIVDRVSAAPVAADQELPALSEAAAEQGNRLPEILFQRKKGRHIRK